MKRPRETDAADFHPTSPPPLPSSPVTDGNEYAKDILEYLHEKEKKHWPSKFNQKLVTPKMRAILMDWLVAVCEDYRLSHGTLFLSFALIDQIFMLQTIGLKS
jgi:hypothetical protein